MERPTASRSRSRRRHLFLLLSENLLGLSAGADGGQQQVNELKASTAAVANIDPATLDKLKELGATVFAMPTLLHSLTQVCVC